MGLIRPTYDPNLLYPKSTPLLPLNGGRLRRYLRALEGFSSPSDSCCSVSILFGLTLLEFLKITQFSIPKSDLFASKVGGRSGELTEATMELADKAVGFLLSAVSLSIFSYYTFWVIILVGQFTPLCFGSHVGTLDSFNLWNF